MVRRYRVGVNSLLAYWHSRAHTGKWLVVVYPEDPVDVVAYNPIEVYVFDSSREAQEAFPNLDTPGNHQYLYPPLLLPERYPQFTEVENPLE